MHSIQLNNIRLFGRHGWHKEEAVIGNEFELSVSINFNSETAIKTLADTINYVAVFEVIKKVFINPYPLLESLLQQIVTEIYDLDNRITFINISISKLNVPIPNFMGTVGVTYSKKFETQ